MANITEGNRGLLDSLKKTAERCRENGNTTPSAEITAGSVEEIDINSDTNDEYQKKKNELIQLYDKYKNGNLSNQERMDTAKKIGELRDQIRDQLQKEMDDYKKDAEDLGKGNSNAMLQAIIEANNSEYEKLNELLNGKVCGYVNLSKPVTAEQVRACKSYEEYLDLVMPWYQYYCEKYGIKYPGVLALQSLHETVGLRDGHMEFLSDCGASDNNMGGLKYAESIPNATPGSLAPADEGSVPYCHFNSISDYIEAQVWNISDGDSGGYYVNALGQGSMEDFASTLIRTWVGNGGPGYSAAVIDEYHQYGLSDYEF